MKKIFILACIFFMTARAYSADIILGLGIHTGFIPEMGGSLTSYYQEDTLKLTNGVYGINRKADGIETKKIDPLLGRSAGIDADFIFMQYILLKFSLNAAIDQYGGYGVSMNHLDEAMTVTYSLMIFDMPAALGITIPAGGSARIALCAGLAPSYGIYKNKFQAASSNSSGTFTGFAMPMIILLKGDYFLNESISVTSSFSAYKGATGPVRSGDDYARIDFSGIRWDIGASYHFKLKTRLKSGQ